MTLTLPIEAGKKYVRRSGAIIEVDLVRGGLVHLVGSMYAQNYESSGSVYLGGYGSGHPHDLVADYIEPAVIEPASVGHVHAASMLLYAQDAVETDKPWERWEHRYKRCNWVDKVASPLWNSDYEYRRKPFAPKFITINGIEVPEPMRVAPAEHTTYFSPCLSDQYAFTTYRDWRGNSHDLYRLEQGTCHLTREAAELHATALLSFTKAK